MSYWRMGLLALIVVAAYVVGRFVRARLPKPRAKSIFAFLRPWIAFFWLWEPVLWFLPGALWAFNSTLLGLKLALILVTSFLVPLSAFLLFFIVAGMYGLRGPRIGISTLLALAGTALVWLVTVIVIAVGFFNTRLLSETRYLLFLVSLLWGPLVTAVLLVLWSTKVVPLAPWTEHPTRNALAMIVGYFTSSPRPAWVIEDGEVRSRVEGNVFFGSGPGYLLTEPENVVVLKTASQFTRVAGPGVVLTRPRESPYKVVDLRNQIRTAKVDGITRDGIDVRLPISSLFRIDRGPKPVELGEPWPYRNQTTVFQAMGAETVQKGGNPMDGHETDPWENLSLSIAGYKLKQAISFYSYDQLFGGIPDLARALRVPSADEAELMDIHERVQKALGLRPVTRLGDPLTRTTIGKLVRQAVRLAVGPRGLEILGGSVGNKIEPLRHEVTEQKIRGWRSRLAVKVLEWRGESQRLRLKSIDTARVTARSEVFTALADSVTTSRRQIGPLEQKDLVALQLVSRLREVAQDLEVQKMLSASALPALENLYRQVCGDDAKEPGASK